MATGGSSFSGGTGSGAPIVPVPVPLPLPVPLPAAAGANNEAAGWRRARVFVGGALMAVCFATFGYQVWRGRAPAAVTVQPLAGSSRSAEIRVQVTGAVAQPGVYRLLQGDRVEDAVRAAGGLVPAADAEQLNLAQRVRDEQRLDILFVPSPPPAAPPGESAPTEAGSGPVEVAGVDAAGGAGTVGAASVGETASRISPTATAGPAPTVRPTSGSSSGTATKLNVNTADQAALEQLPGIGAVSAKKILAYRAANGPLHSLDDLRRAGISEALIRRAADSITFG